MLESKLPRTGADLAIGSGVGATGGRIESAADVAGRAWILRVEAVARAVEFPGGEGGGGIGWESGGGAGCGLGGQLKEPVLPDGSDGCRVEVCLA